MLKKTLNSKPNYRFLEDYYVCTPFLNCEAHDAAQAAVDAAQTAYDNAVALRDSLKKELDATRAVVSDLKSTFDSISECGTSVNSPAIMGNDGGLADLIACVAGYGSAVEGAYNNCVSEVSSCAAKLSAAKTKLAATPCFWDCR